MRQMQAGSSLPRMTALDGKKGGGPKASIDKVAYAAAHNENNRFCKKRMPAALA
jgi:hypothetical protein